MEWLEEVEEEPWTYKDFQPRWKLASQASRAKKELKAALVERWRSAMRPWQSTLQA